LKDDGRGDESLKDDRSGSLFQRKVRSESCNTVPGRNMASFVDISTFLYFSVHQISNQADVEYFWAMDYGKAMKAKKKPSQVLMSQVYECRFSIRGGHESVNLDLCDVRQTIISSISRGILNAVQVNVDASVSRLGYRYSDSFGTERVRYVRVARDPTGAHNSRGIWVRVTRLVLKMWKKKDIYRLTFTNINADPRLRHTYTP